MALPSRKEVKTLLIAFDGVTPIPTHFRSLRAFEVAFIVLKAYASGQLVERMSEEEMEIIAYNVLSKKLFEKDEARRI